MSKSNSLGFVIGGENQNVSLSVAPPPAAAEPVSPSTTVNRERLACCVLTGLLVVAGIGVGVWYAVTEAM